MVSLFDHTLFCTTCASIQCSAFLGEGFSEVFFKRSFSISSYVVMQPPPIVAPPYPGDHVLNKRESTLPEDASTQV